MKEEEYRNKMNSLPYTGLQLVHMEYDEAYEFAGAYGMNAIVTTFKPPYEMMLVRLHQDGNGRLRVGNVNNGYVHGVTEIDPKKYDIYWIGKK